MTLAPFSSSPIPFPLRSVAHGGEAVALAAESATVDVTELVELAGRLDRHAVRDGARVSALALIAKAFLVASLRHPTVDARWPRLPDRHGVRLSELTAALDGADAASPVPDDAAVLSVDAVTRQPAEVDGRIELRELVGLRLAYDPRRTDAVEAARLLAELAAILADPWELLVAC